jgi:c(7)-type cytochrome triheme protein
MRSRRRILILAVLACIAAVSLLASEQGKKKRLLSTFFDGVPTAEEREAERARKKAARLPRQPAAAALEMAAPAALPVDKPRPAVEQLKTWEEVLHALPRDITGGPDWVKAVREGVIAPRHRLPSDTALAAPFTLDNLVPGTISETAPALDLNIEFIPVQASFYRVVFPHAGHTLWLNCSSCHPGIVSQHGSGMQKIFAGEYCGKCHGKVAFAPISSCARCHVNLAPASPQVIEADLEKAEKAASAATPELIERGRLVYLQACVPCHGEHGDGQGLLAPVLDPKPRNFTAGKFKFRSTSFSSLPTDYDLFRTITRGIPGTSMPGFSGLPYDDRFALLHFLKTFSDRFLKQKPTAALKIPEPPPITPELIELGKKFFKEAECFKCHGYEGRGDGPSAVGMKDDWGEPLRPFDFTSGRPKGGGSVKDYYRDLMTGLQGTPMPDFGEIFEPEQAWGVVYYVHSLGNAGRELPPAVKGDIYFTRKAPGPSVDSTAPRPGERGPAEGHLQAVLNTHDDQEENVPPATFPHWFHRLRVRCAVCHSSIFEMKAGANPITMDAIRSGQFCGKCHPSYPDSKALAWPVAFESCVRCHVAR